MNRYKPFLAPRQDNSTPPRCQFCPRAQVQSLVRELKSDSAWPNTRK